MHQHPPKIPLLRSTSSAKASHVEASRGRIVLGIVESFRARAVSALFSCGSEELGELDRLADHRPVARVDVDKVKVLGLGELGYVTGADPLLSLGGSELRAYEH